MSQRGLFLRRLREAVGDSVHRSRRWILRALAWLSIAIVLALSVGWWVYSHTTDQELYLKAGQLSRAARYQEAVRIYEKIQAHTPRTDLAERALFDAATVYHYHLGDLGRAT